MAGAVLGEAQVSLFVAGAVLGVAVIGEFGKIAGARNVVFFNMASAESNLRCAAGCGPVSFSDHARNGLGWPRIVNDVSAVFSKFLSDFGWPFCVAGARFGEVGGWHLLLRAL